jgi:hypothetical protein
MEMSAEFTEAVNRLAAAMRPALDELHKYPASTKDYYGDYMDILSRQPSAGHVKLVALAMIKAGANVYGVESAVKLISN